MRASHALALAAVLASFAASPASAAEKFAMSVYHFNIQYVQGGLRGFPDGNNDDPAFDMDDQQVMDAIIDEGFEPLLDLYLKHPTWGADIELQGYMIEVIQRDRPAVLAKLKQLADAGKVHVDSFHYGDQWWLAYPRRDAEAGYDLTLEAFRNAGIPHGASLWTQEGQWGPGMGRFAKERGLKATIMPRNLFHWVRPGEAVEPIYDLGDGVSCVVTTGAHNDVLETTWNFVDDGELAMTNKKNPYLGKNFKKDPASIAKLEEELQATEDAGFRLSSVADFVTRAREIQPNPPALPTMLDGTWQPDDTGNVLRWMGDGGLLNGTGAEADNAVLTTNARVGRLVREAETVANALGDAKMQAGVKAAWKLLLLAECSDSTGWNPWVAEKDFSLDHAAQAEALVAPILAGEDVKPRLQPARTLPALVDAAAPFVVTPIIAAMSPNDPTPSRTASLAWKQRSGTQVFELVASFSEAAGPHTIGLNFPRSGDRLVVSQALEEGALIDLALADLGPDVVTAALPNGLVALGPDTFLVLKTDSVHLAAQLPKAEAVVRFTDQTAPRDPVSWTFVVVKGTKEAALAEALALNVAPAEVLGPEQGCGCGGSSGVLLLLPLALGFARIGRKSRRFLA